MCVCVCVCVCVLVYKANKASPATKAVETTAETFVTREAGEAAGGGAGERFSGRLTLGHKER